ncbi:MAG: hypothetical protein IPK73_20885 [Candidatus Obscuribacter sp.]|nr:hypothetical protein [Candidatus Obscuribacter sp.]MBK9276573.1 hypothetical protein [Candidatus Obscuribacter sp.]
MATIEDHRVQDAPAEKAGNAGLTIADINWTNVKDSSMNQTGDKPISNLGFPSESTIMISDKTEQPRDAKTDKNGNLVEFKIGPETNESQVEVKYVNPNDQNPVVDNVQLSRPDGQKISYQRERSDPQDANSPFSYSETRDNMKGNLQFPGVEVGKDGKVSVFFDFAHKKPALWFNPTSGAEEYP